MGGGFVRYHFKSKSKDRLYFPSKSFTHFFTVQTSRLWNDLHSVWVQIIYGVHSPAAFLRKKLLFYSSQMVNFHPPSPISQLFPAWDHIYLFCIFYDDLLLILRLTTCEKHHKFIFISAKGWLEEIDMQCVKIISSSRYSVYIFFQVSSTQRWNPQDQGSIRCHRASVRCRGPGASDG